MNDSINKLTTIKKLIKEIDEKKSKISYSSIVNYVKLELKIKKLQERLKEVKSIEQELKKDFIPYVLVKDENAEKILKEHIAFLDSILKYKNTFIKDILMPFAVAIIVVPIVYLIVNPSKEEIAKKYEAQQKEYEVGDAQSAWSYIQIYVENQLKDPSSADFPFGGYRDVTYVSNGLYMFKSYVDSKNSFNATVRVHFEGNIQRINGGWEIVNFRFIEK